MKTPFVILPLVVILLLLVLMAESKPRVCYRKPCPGPCKAYFVRYYYNPYRRRCEQFIWGGCRSNGNNFKSRRACQKTCGYGYNIGFHKGRG
ncbi:Kunitz-type serine protease inhibitor taicotoxin [Amphibalanus amphitrite]|uniref:Kunitz-type serine protease inhibitor taicotoxin n=1 Tax=Amphibalanus amphitrite TaxID=1232801 RepID=A0A6A4WI47_AMPAM|nr:Kunitz-type serine protease inhibitor taicotoxin [Amphibalanus amphitrite]